MTFHESPQITALHLRDYFWIQYRPRPGDEKPWRRVECAAIRIAESVGFLRPDYSYETQKRHAARVRRAARECQKLIPDLGAEEWTLLAAIFFEEIADVVLEVIGEPTGHSRQH